MGVKRNKGGVTVVIKYDITIWTGVERRLEIAQICRDVGKAGRISDGALYE